MATPSTENNIQVENTNLEKYFDNISGGVTPIKSQFNNEKLNDLQLNYKYQSGSPISCNRSTLPEMPSFSWETTDG